MFSLLSIGLMACGNAGDTHDTSTAVKHDHSAMDHTSEQEMLTHSSARKNENQSMTRLIDHYLRMKDALVLDDAESAAAAANELLSSVVEFDFSTYEEAKHAEIKEGLNVIAEYSALIVKSELDTQRMHFSGMTNVLLKLWKLAGPDRKLYHQYCPMYNGNEGGYWLSDSKEIRNPLFGSMMLGCGRVVESL